MLMALITVVFCVDPANAQATRSWISGVGDDANPCSRTAPCKTFAGAISKTAIAGEIDCLDSGGFGAVTITKSITIDCEPVIGGVLVSGTNGIVVSAAGAIVTLRGLDFEGLGSGLVGINVLAVGVLHVEKCIIRDFKAGAALGISFEPSANGQLFVEDTIISDNGTGTFGGGIQIKPTGTAAANVTLVRVNLEGNVAGFVADSSGGTGSIVSTVKDSVASGNTADGWLATGSTTRNVLFVDHSFGVEQRRRRRQSERRRQCDGARQQFGLHRQSDRRDIHERWGAVLLQDQCHQWKLVGRNAIERPHIELNVEPRSESRMRSPDGGMTALPRSVCIAGEIPPGDFSVTVSFLSGCCWSCF
jgi:hypothetical protein